MTQPIGIVQGRLSPPMPGRLQAFPWRSWASEFERARACGFEAIEWVFEADRHEENPLWDDRGVAAITERVAETGVAVASVCADYFMTRPLFGVLPRERAGSTAVLERLIRQAGHLGCRTLLVPVLEATEIRTARDRADLIEALRPLLDLAAGAGVRIGLETELAAADYRSLIDEIDHPAAGAYYDVGNATAKGFDASADIAALGPCLCGVHVKDRRRGGPSVPLGSGDVDFGAFFAALVSAGYDGPIVLQPATSADYLGVARSYLAFVRHHLQGAGARAR